MIIIVNGLPRYSHNTVRKESSRLVWFKYLNRLRQVGRWLASKLLAELKITRMMFRRDTWRMRPFNILRSFHRNIYEYYVKPEIVFCFIISFHCICLI